MNPTDTWYALFEAVLAKENTEEHITLINPHIATMTISRKTGDVQIIPEPISVNINSLDSTMKFHGIPVDGWKLQQ
jgi:hypothetical protein